MSCKVVTSGEVLVLPVSVLGWVDWVSLCLLTLCSALYIVGSSLQSKPASDRWAQDTCHITQSESDLRSPTPVSHWHWHAIETQGMLVVCRGLRVFQRHMLQAECRQRRWESCWVQAAEPLAGSGITALSNPQHQSLLSGAQGQTVGHFTAITHTRRLCELVWRCRGSTETLV